MQAFSTPCTVFMSTEKYDVRTQCWSYMKGVLTCTRCHGREIAHTVRARVHTHCAGLDLESRANSSECIRKLFPEMFKRVLNTDPGVGGTMQDVLDWVKWESEHHICVCFLTADVRWPGASYNFPSIMDTILKLWPKIRLSVLGVYICACVCVLYEHMCVHVFANTQVWHVCKCVCAHMSLHNTSVFWICLHSHVYACTCIHACIHVLMYVCIWVSAFTCVSGLAYVYTYTN